MFNVSNILSRQMSKVRLCSGLVELFNSRSRLKCQSKVNLWYVSTLQRSLAIIFSIRWGLGTMLCSWCNKPTQRKWWLARMYLKKKLWNRNGNKVSIVIWQVFFFAISYPRASHNLLAMIWGITVCLKTHLYWFSLISGIIKITKLASFSWLFWRWWSLLFNSNK